MRTIRTPKNRAAFLAALSEGTSVSGSCDAANIGTTAAYAWRNEDPEFAAEWEAALEAGTDKLEDEAFRRAHKGVSKPVFHQGVQCGVIQEYSDTLTIFLLKGRRPQKYAERKELTGANGAALIPVLNVSVGDD